MLRRLKEDKLEGLPEKAILVGTDQNNGRSKYVPDLACVMQDRSTIPCDDLCVFASRQVLINDPADKITLCTSGFFHKRGYSGSASWSTALVKTRRHYSNSPWPRLRWNKLGKGPRHADFGVAKWCLVNYTKTIDCGCCSVWSCATGRLEGQNTWKYGCL